MLNIKIIAKLQTKWTLDKELTKILWKMCNYLHSLIQKFNLLIFRLIGVNAIKYKTLPSLALAIYSSNFLENDYNIPKLHGEIYKFN